jgi:hypothetical protein
MPSEKRIAPRRRQRLRVWIEHEGALIPCVLVDVSKTGAKISGKLPPLPEAFVLWLTQDGKVRRAYQRVWQARGEAGVRLVAKLRQGGAPIDLADQD